MSQPATQVLRSFSPSQPTIRPYCLSKLCNYAMREAVFIFFDRDIYISLVSLTLYLGEQHPPSSFEVAVLFFLAYLKAVTERLKKDTMQCTDKQF